MNFVKLKDIMETDRISPDHWPLYEWDGLNELDFKSDGDAQMTFEYIDSVDGKEKKLILSTYKKKDGWYLESSVNDKTCKTETFPSNKNLMDRIHEIFEKF